MIYLSILIPVYNAENYIERCLNSIIKQNAFDNNVEIVIINDGSKDNSLAIINRYTTEHANIHVVSRENKGIGKTRNELIECCQGEYFWFIDADDYISEDALETTLPLLNDSAYDMILLSYNWISSNSTKQIIYDGEFTSGLELTDNGIYNNSVWTRIYRKSVIINNNIVFNSFGMGEDFDFIFRLTPYIKAVKCIKRPLYNYMFNPNSAINNINKKHQLKMSEDSLLCIFEDQEYLNKLSKPQQAILYEPLLHFILGYVYSLYHNHLSFSYKWDCIKRLKEHDVLPIQHIPQHGKKRLLSLVLNNKFITCISLYCFNLFKRIK